MTVIICPACSARYEIAAIIPPQGRRVRCSKCAHVWQAMAVVEAVRPPAVSEPPPPAAAPPPAPTLPGPAPAPAASAEAKDQVAGFLPKQTNGPLPGGPSTPEAGADASFDGDEDLQPDVGGGDAQGTISSWSSSEPSAEPSGQDLGSFNVGAHAGPAAEAAADVSIAAARRKPKRPSPAAIGWGVIALLLAVLAAMVALAPKTVVSVLPGANRLYAMIGNPVIVSDLAIVDVHSGWGVAGGQRVLQVGGNIVNLTGGEVTVPTVVIALQDEAGAVISELATDVAPLAPGAKMPFSVQIASAPETVRSVKVSFAKAD